MDYSRQINTAERLIAKYGGPATLYVTTTPTDGDKEWNALDDTVDGTPIIACFLSNRQNYKPGAVVHVGDMKVLIAAKNLSLSPNLQGRITRTVNGEDESWKISSCSPLNVDGQQGIMYTLQVTQ
jgi:hypothetical protein